MNVSSSGPFNKANIFLGLIEYDLNSLLGASHLVDYISVHIRFDLERYFLNIHISIFGVVSPLGANLSFSGPLGFDAQTNSDHKTHKNRALLSPGFKTLSE